MKRLLLICVLAAGFASAALAGTTAPTLSASCPCVGDGSFVSVNASGLRAGTSYFWDALGPNGFAERSGTFTSSTGSAVFQVGPVSQAGLYTVTLYTSQGRGTIKVTAQTVFTAQ